MNVSGVRTFFDICNALQNFNSAFKTDIGFCDVIIDNSTSTGLIRLCDSGRRLNLHRLQQHILCTKYQQKADRYIVHFSLRPHFFPGGVLRLYKPFRGSAIVFSSRKYIIVGARSCEEINATVELLCACIHRSLRTSTPAT